MWLARKLLKPSRIRVSHSGRAPHPAILWLGRPLVRTAQIVSVVASLALTSFGQSSARTPSTPTKRFCQQIDGFCFTYPASWLILSEYDAGVIVAPQQSLDPTLWDEVTVATIVAPTVENQPAMSIDQVIETAMTNMKASGHDAATLQRQERTVAGLPAQIIRIRYHDEPSGRDWIEQLVFIEGTDQQIYSIALKGQPGTISRLEPAFDAMVGSWKLHSGESNTVSRPSEHSRSKPASSVPH